MNKLILVYFKMQYFRFPKWFPIEKYNKVITYFHLFSFVAVIIDHSTINGKIVLCVM